MFLMAQDNERTAGVVFTGFNPLIQVYVFNLKNADAEIEKKVLKF